MAQIVLADEVNRATPKTQAALLEAMEERQVTVDGKTYPLPHPFMVQATLNPIEYQGTFPLPEGQLDRFLLRIHLGYPAPQDEIDIMRRQQFHHPITQLEQVASADELASAQEAVRSVYVAPAVERYIVQLINQTRQHPDLMLGASPRGSLALYRAGQARAAMLGRDHVLPDDIKFLAPYALAHRLILTPAARLRDVQAVDVIASILDSLPVPGVESK